MTPPKKELASASVVTLRVRVTPRAKVSALSQTAEGDWVARLKAPPVDGKANEELVALIAERFHCRKAAVTIHSGATSRIKVVKVRSEK